MIEATIDGTEVISLGVEKYPATAMGVVDDIIQGRVTYTRPERYLRVRDLRDEEETGRWFDVITGFLVSLEGKFKPGTMVMVGPKAMQHRHRSGEVRGYSHPSGYAVVMLALGKAAVLIDPDHLYDAKG
jgi:hypothetical protein